MKLSKALKLKNKLVKEANEQFERFNQNNSIIADNSRDYDPGKAFELFQTKTEELVKLKAKIHIANAPVYEDIFRLSELKNLANKLKAVQTKDGTVTAHDRYRGVTETTTYSAYMTKVHVDEAIKLAESQIEQIQEKLEQFNATTHIED